MCALRKCACSLVALDHGLHRNVVRLVAAQREQRREKGAREGARIGEQSREHDVIVCAPLGAPVPAIEVVFADDAIEAVRHEIRLEVRELELTAVIERRVIAHVREVFGETREPRRARGGAEDRRVRLRRPSAQNRGEPLGAAVARRVDGVEQNAGVRERIEVRRDAGEPPEPTHHLRGGALPNDENDVRPRDAQEMARGAVRGMKQRVDQSSRLRLGDRGRVRIAGAIVADRERVEKIPRDVEPRLVREVAVREVGAAGVEWRPLQSAANRNEEENAREQQRRRRSNEPAARRLARVCVDDFPVRVDAGGDERDEDEREQRDRR